MELLEIKVGAFVLLLALAYAGGVLPLRFGASPRSAQIFSLSNAFAGGLFIAVGLIHMLGDGAEGFDEADVGTDYPLELAIATAGFLGILLLEAVVAGRVRAGLGETHQRESAETSAGVRARLLTVVLSVHSLMAGIAIGAETEVAAAVAILVAIVAHKGPEGYALGISLQQAGTPRRALIRSVMTYAVMTPVGIVLGTVLATALTGRTNLVFEAVFDSLAAGTFIYVATFGVLKDEFAAPEMLGRKYLGAALGAVLIAVVSIWA